MRWAGRVERMEEKRNAYCLLVCESHKENLCGLIILRWILERYDRVVSTGLVWLRIGTSGELL
jgi:hypothetical protein